MLPAKLFFILKNKVSNKEITEMKYYVLDFQPYFHFYPPPPPPHPFFLHFVALSFST